MRRHDYLKPYKKINFTIGSINFYKKLIENGKTKFEGVCECGNIVKRLWKYINICIKNNIKIHCGCKNQRLQYWHLH